MAYKTKKKKMIHRNNVEKFAWVFLSVLTCVLILPVIYVVILSFTAEESLVKNGYQLIPDKLSVEAYQLLFGSYGKSLGRAVLLTVGSGVVTPILSIFLSMCMAYPLSQPDFKGKGFWNKYLVITMMFGGGLIPTYLLMTKVLMLRNNILIYFVPGVGAWSVILFRTFFKSIDHDLIGSAEIDGATNLKVLLHIMLPLTKPLVAMEFFSAFLGRWNDINTCLYYITDKRLYTVQYLLQQMLKNAELAKEMIRAGMSFTTTATADFPVESTRYALAVIGMVPALILFPYLQKYYAKGVMLGSLKG